MYTLVNVYQKTMEISTFFIAGKFTSSTWPFSIANCNKLPEGKFIAPKKDQQVASYENGESLPLSPPLNLFRGDYQLLSNMYVGVFLPNIYPGVKY